MCVCASFLWHVIREFMLVIVTTAWEEDVCVCVCEEYTETTCLDTRSRNSRMTELSSLVFVQVVVKLTVQEVK